MLILAKDPGSPSPLKEMPDRLLMQASEGRISTTNLPYAKERVHCPLSPISLSAPWTKKPGNPVWSPPHAAFPVISEWWWRRKRTLFDIVPDAAAREALARQAAVAEARPYRQESTLELEWRGENDVADLRRLLKARGLARVEVRRLKTSPLRGSVPLQVVRKPRNWFRYLRAFTPKERAALRPVLEAMERSRAWPWTLCDTCGRRFTVKGRASSRGGNIKNCYLCRCIPATTRWRRHRLRRGRGVRSRSPRG